MRNNSGVKKKRVWILALLPLFLTACSATELEDRCFPMAAIADGRMGQVEFAYGFPELSQKANTDVKEAKMDFPMTRGEDFKSALEKYEEQLDKKVDGNHLKVLIMGKELAENKDMYLDMTGCLQRENYFPRNTYVCVVENLGELLDIQSDLSTDLGSYVESFLLNHEKEKGTELVNLGSLMDEISNQGKTLELPYLSVKDGAIIWDKFWVMSGEND